MPSGSWHCVALYLRMNVSATNFLLDQFGLYFDHDWALISIPPSNCCARDPPPELECLPISVSKNDPFYSQFNVTCISTRRALSLPRHCSKVRAQYNVQSSYIDGSATYGTTTKLSRSLRTFEGGLLRTSTIHGRPMLPKSDDNRTACLLPSNYKYKCFKSGDLRVNLSVQLATIQTLFHREHNRIVRVLSYLNKHWDDERLYQEGRRILGAIVQHISFNHVLPLFLGPRTMVKYDLYSSPIGHETRYDPKRSSTAGLAASIAFRFHGLVPGRPYLIKSNNRRHYFNVSDAIEAPTLLYQKGHYDGMLKGMVTDGIQTNTRFITSELTTKVQKEFGAPYGSDLGAFDVHRCRDFGLPGYNAFRQYCGLKKFTTFEEMTPFLFDDVVPILKRLYNSVDDIDLVVGGRSERHLSRALIGPTYACILGRTFKRFKYGDRYWYENEFEYMKFSFDQLTEIKKASTSRLVCDNSDKIDRMPRNAFLVPSNSNRMVPCSDIDQIDLTHWKEG